MRAATFGRDGHGVPDPSLPGWLPENRARLDALLRTRGVTSPGYDPAHRPVATFDWDNTMMWNDIGDLTMAWMLRHDAILQPPQPRIQPSQRILERVTGRDLDREATE